MFIFSSVWMKAMKKVIYKIFSLFLTLNTYKKLKQRSNHIQVLKFPLKCRNDVVSFFCYILGKRSIVAS